MQTTFRLLHATRQTQHQHNCRECDQQVYADTEHDAIQVVVKLHNLHTQAKCIFANTVRHGQIT